MSRRLVLPALVLGTVLASALVFSAPAFAQAVTYTSPQNPQNTPPSPDVSYARIVRLSYVEGDVQVLRPEESAWEPALLNLPIEHGYALATHQGRAEIEFESGATARLAENTVLRFTELVLSDGNRLTSLTLQQGSAVFYANLARNDRFLVLTPHLTVTVPSNARFRVDVTGNGAWVTAHKGEVSVEARDTVYRVTKNRTLHFQALDERVVMARAEEPDDFDRWSADREEVLVAGRERAGRYVSTGGYNYGVSDLNYYGGWYNVPGYGYGWRPYGVTLSWMPYYHGTWRHSRRHGWTWIGFEPWGWLPYHYGNWVYSPTLGWLWIPDNFNRWCPARVYYVWSNNRVHWGPLGPHDRPGQRPQNLPHGTVTHGPPAGYSGVSHLTRADLGPEAGAKIYFEPPQQFDDEIRIRRPRAVPSATAGGSPVDAPAGGTPAPRNVVGPGAGTLPSRGNDPQGRAEPPAPRYRGNDGGAPGGIAFDPQTGRYVNNAPPPARNFPSGEPDTREGISRLPRIGDGNPQDSVKPRAVPQKPVYNDRRNDYDSPPPRINPQPRNDEPGARPRYESRPSYSPPPANEPRAYTPAPPRAEPRPYSPAPPRAEPRPYTPPPPRAEPRSSPPPRPSSPPPRMESPRPSSPPARVESPRPSPRHDAGPRPNRPRD
jgi:hypothetical protein